jgi:thioredoxin-related protein
MKKHIVSLVLLFAATTIAFSQTAPLKWYTIQEAVALNAKNPKKIMVDVYTDWCGWCKRMDAETFSNPVIAEYISKNFYPVKYNAESKEPVEFAGKKFVNLGGGSRSTNQFAEALLQNQMSYPSVAYLTEDLQLIGAIPGYYKPADLEPLINFIAQNKYKEMKFEDFKATFKSSFK